MKFFDALFMSAQGLRERKYRVALNVLGILVGCAAVTGLISLAAGMNLQVKNQLSVIGVNTLFIEPGSPWENGYVESFNGKLRDELLDREIFNTALEAKVLIERWRIDYNTHRPHSALGYCPPAPEAIWPVPPGSGAPPLHLPALIAALT